MPLVSVIIPAYNHARFIRETIDSVLQQTFTDYEIIVVNDGSPDDTAEVLRPYINRKQIIYLEQPNAGQAAARNRGICEAAGEYIALLDDDDCWPPNKLAWQVERLRSDENLLLVSGEIRDDFPSTLRDEREPLAQPRVASFESILVGNPIVSPGQTLIRKSALAAVSGFREEVWGADDWDLYLRLSRLGRLELYLRPALFYRRHAGNASHQMVRLVRNALNVLHTHLPAVEASARPGCYVEARRWIYLFGFSRAVHDLKEDWHRRDIAAVRRGFVEIFRRLRVLNFDPVVLQSLICDCVPKRFGLTRKTPGTPNG